MNPFPPAVSRLERIIEISTWAIMILALFGVRFLPKDPIGNTQTYYLIGAILSFALIYYLVIYRYFSKTNRLYLKSMADIILIGTIIHLSKDYGHFFYALYFLPIAATALSLELVNALLIASIAALFVVFEIFLESQALLPANIPISAGIWQIIFILMITVFCRFLAVQLRQEQALKEESLARQRALEREAQKEKEFLSLTSHQLYTPTSIIRGFASLLKSKSLGELSTKQADAVEEIYFSAKRIASLVQELLSISRIQAGSFRLNLVPTDIRALLESVVKQLNVTKENKDVTVELKPDGRVVPIRADEEKIRDVLYNLIGNGIKYTPKGKITVSARQTEEETVVTVEDQGIGISPGDFEKLFQPFFRGKNILELDNKGTGLGLYISRLIIEKHNGKIWAESAGTNKGSRFVFILPNN